MVEAPQMTHTHGLMWPGDVCECLERLPLHSCQLADAVGPTRMRAAGPV